MRDRPPSEARYEGPAEEELITLLLDPHADRRRRRITLRHHETEQAEVLDAAIATEWLER